MSVIVAWVLSGQQIQPTQIASPMDASVVAKAERFLILSPRPPFLTIAGNPLAGSDIAVYRNGQLLEPGGVGYTLAGKVITPVVIASGDRWTIRYLEAITITGSTFTVSPDGTRASFGSIQFVAVNPNAVADIDARVFGSAPTFDVRGAGMPGDVDIIGRGWSVCCLEIERMFPQWSLAFPPVSTVRLNRGVFSLP